MIDLFQVRVQVFNDECQDQDPECQSPLSQPVVIHSAEGLPQVAPTSVRAWNGSGVNMARFLCRESPQVGARPFNSTAITVFWNEIPSEREKIRGKLIGYRIKYWRQDLNEITESQYLLSR